MNLKTGTIIRELRVKAGITQEKLANHLGVSVQAVSRWESETCYPDLEFIPKIANYFRVSADYLLGVNRYDTAETAAEYERRWTAAVKNADHDQAMEIITEALTIMPKNYGLMLKKALSLLIAAGIAEEEKHAEDARKYMDECETLANIVLAECESERLRCEAQMYLICVKRFHDDDRNAIKALAEDLPDVKCTKNSMLAAFYGLTSEEHDANRRAFLYELFFHFFTTSLQLARVSHIPDEEKITIAKALLQILDLVTDGPPYGEFELYLDTLYLALYECTGDEQYCHEPDCYEKRYEALPAKFTYEKGFFKGYTFDHEQTIHNIDGSAK